jgi:hypothetical protein
MKSKIKIRTDVLQQWMEVNPVLLNGEIAYISDTKSWRIGNGAWRFSELQNFPLAPSYNDLTDKPTLGTAAATDATAYATAAQGAKADSALQPAALTPYRTSSDQDTIDAGKASTSHKSTHATGGTDALTPADIGASATGHAHSAEDVNLFQTQDPGTGNEWTPVDANEVAGRANAAFHSVNSVGADVANHISNFSNPHQVTAAQLGAAETSAENTFSAPQVISGTSESTMLRVTQLGSGEALRVEDESPESTAFVISNKGNVGIGVDPDANVGLSVNSSGIKFSDGSIQSSSATGMKTVLAQTTQNVSGTFSGNEFLVTGTTTLVVDGYIPPVGGIVAFASQAAPAQNGFWRVAVNNGQTQPILERPTWFSSTTTNVSPLVYITRHGATQAGFVMALTGPLGLNIVVGTTALTVHRISGRAPAAGIVAIPATSNSTGTVGQIAVDDANNFLYVCTAANVWKRTPLTTF